MGRSFTVAFSDHLSFSSIGTKIYSFLNPAPMIFGWNDIYMFFFSEVCHVIIIREINKVIPIKQFLIYI